MEQFRGFRAVSLLLLGLLSTTEISGLQNIKEHSGPESKDKRTFLLLLSSQLSNWTPWQIKTPCSSTCGAGNKTESRSCQFMGLPSPFCKGDSVRVTKCEGPPCKVDGQWSEWKDWTSCSRTCGQGVRNRIRLCNNPLPSNGGAVCLGIALESQLCNIKTCPITTTPDPPKFEWKTVEVPLG